MAYYILFYETVENYIERRALFRKEHLGLAQESAEKGQMVLGGAYAEPADGAAIVFKGDDASVAEQFAINDPYVKNGLISKWWVREWTVVINAFIDS
ncbi:MAG: hypothetical protein HKN87_04185 [Saprospiraceae bacterium]|nr:hypothetical protein [Saprospiraceae bacterium]